MRAGLFRHALINGRYLCKSIEREVEDDTSDQAYEAPIAVERLEKTSGTKEKKNPD